MGHPQSGIPQRYTLLTPKVTAKLKLELFNVTINIGHAKEN